MGHAQSIQLRINLIITRGDGRNDKPERTPKEDLAEMCRGLPQYATKEKDGKYSSKVTVDDLGLEDLGREKGQARSISGAAAKTAKQAERLAAARALEALSVKRQVEDLSAAGYAAACLSPYDSELRKFRAVEDCTPTVAEEHALAFKRGDEIVLTSTQWHNGDSWVHGRHVKSGAVGGFPPSKIAQPEAPRLSGFDPNVIAVRTGSIRGAGWGKFFEQVRSQAIRQLRVVSGWVFDRLLCDFVGEIRHRAATARGGRS